MGDDRRDTPDLVGICRLTAAWEAPMTHGGYGYVRCADHIATQRGRRWETPLQLIVVDHIDTGALKVGVTG
jgi:hypothetical protein